MNFKIDTKSSYFKFALTWILLGLICYVILLFLNEWLETKRFILIVLAVSGSGFATRWIFRYTYRD